MGKGTELPKIVIFCTWILHFLGYCLALVAFPTHLWVLFTVSVFGQKSIWENKALYSVLWIFRFIFTTFALPFWAGQAAGLGYGLFVATQTTGVAIGAGIGFAVGTVIGLLYLAYGPPKKVEFLKINWTSKGDNRGYFASLGQALYDFVTFLAFLLCVVCFWRLISIALAANRSKPTKWRKELPLQAFLGFIDVLTFPFLLLSFLFFWRIHYMFHLFSKELSSSTEAGYKCTVSVPIRGCIILTILQGLADIPVFLFTTLFCTFVPWRFYYLVQKLEKRKSISGARAAFLKQLAYALLDLACCLGGLFIIGTVYRAPVLFVALYRADRGSKRRFAVLALVGLILFELILILPSLILVFITVYRIPKLFNKSRDLGGAERDGEISEPKFQFRTGEQALKVIRDFPFLLTAIFVTVLLWRAPFMWYDVYQANKNWDRRKAIMLHGALIFLDLLDFPFILLGVIIFVTIWRAPALVKELSEVKFESSTDMKNRNKMRWTILLQFCYWFADIPTFLGFFILMITIYRAKITLLELDALRQKYFGVTNNIIPPDVGDEENPAPKTAENRFSWHTVIWRQMALLLIDLPISLLALLTLWRLPWLIKTLVTECETANERRLAVLETILKTGKDFLVAILVLFICLSWRVVSFVDLIKNYKKGDDEHKLVMLLFLQYLIDLPFFLLFLIQLPILWRSIPLILYLIFLPGAKEGSDPAKNRRIGIATTALICFLDFLFGALTIIVFCFVWRIYDFFKLYMKSDPDVEYEDNPYARSFVWYRITGQLFLLVLCDIISIAQLVIIHASILHAPSLYIRGYRLINRYFNETAVTPNLDQTAVEELKYARDQMDNEGIENLSFSSFRILITSECLGSLRDLPHLLMLPLKLVGLLFYPLHVFIRWSLNKNKGTTMRSILAYPLLWLHAVSEPRMNFWGLHSFAILNLAGLSIIIPNYLAVVPMLFNSFLVFLCTFGDPVWAPLRETFGYIGLGSGDGCCGVVDNVILVSNIIWTPILLFAQFVLAFLPIWVFVILTLPFTSVQDYFEMFFLRPDVYWTAVGQVPGWVWIIFAYWLVTMVGAIHISANHIIKYYALFNPLTAYLWLFQRVFAGRIWGFLQLLLGAPTQWAYKNKDACCCIGEIAITPIILIWTCWPAIIPCIIQIYWNPEGWYFWILAGVMMAFFWWHGVIKQMSVVRRKWKKQVKVVFSTNPKFDIQTIRTVFPPSGGFRIEIRGNQTGSLKIEQALLHLEGDKSTGADAFWGTLTRIFGSKSISMAKMTMIPVKLIPNHIDKFKFSTTNFNNISFAIYIPENMTVMGKSIHIKKSMLEPNFKKIVDEGDPEVEFSVEYTSRAANEGSYKKEGFLVRFRAKFGDMLKSAESNSELKCNVMDPTGNWVEHDTALGNDAGGNDEILITKNSPSNPTISLNDIKGMDEVGYISGEDSDPIIDTKPDVIEIKNSKKLKLSIKNKPKKIEDDYEMMDSPLKSDHMDYEALAQIISMGFAEEQAMEALQIYPTKEDAINYLLTLDK